MNHFVMGGVYGKCKERFLHLFGFPLVELQKKYAA